MERVSYGEIEALITWDDKVPSVEEVRISSDSLPKLTIDLAPWSPVRSNDNIELGEIVPSMAVRFGATGGAIIIDGIVVRKLGNSAAFDTLFVGSAQYRGKEPYALESVSNRNPSILSYDGSNTSAEVTLPCNIVLQDGDFVEAGITTIISRRTHYYQSFNVKVVGVVTRSPIIITSELPISGPSFYISPETSWDSGKG